MTAKKVKEVEAAPEISVEYLEKQIEGLITQRDKKVAEANMIVGAIQAATQQIAYLRGEDEEANAMAD